MENNKWKGKILKSKLRKIAQENKFKINIMV